MNSPKSTERKLQPENLVHWPKQEPEAPGAHGFGAVVGRIVPGIVTGTANVDPSLVVTATVVGAAFSYSTLWVVVLCVPFLLAVFSVTARLGFETRRGLVDLLSQRYGRGLALLCAGVIIVINTAMIIADLMAVSEALSVILGQPRVFFAAAVAFSVWYILIFRDYRKIANVLLYFSLPLFAYVAAAIVQAPNARTVLLSSLLPRVELSQGYAAAVIGLFGSLLTPYVLVWQTSMRREQDIAGEEKPHLSGHYAGTFITSLLSYSVVVAAASTLHFANPVEMTTRQAADALRPAVGAAAPLLFALGIIGVGMVALPRLVASLCYAVSEAVGWKAGLSEHAWEAGSFYALISGSMFVAAVVTFFRINPVKAMYFSQILAGVLTMPILLFILVLSNDRKVMRATNTRWQNFWLAACIGGLAAANAALVRTGMR